MFYLRQVGNSPCPTSPLEDVGWTNSYVCIGMYLCPWFCYVDLYVENMFVRAFVRVWVGGWVDV